MGQNEIYDVFIRGIFAGIFIQTFVDLFFDIYNSWKGHKWRWIGLIKPYEKA